MGTQQILLVILGVIMVGVAMALGTAAATAQKTSVTLATATPGGGFPFPGTAPSPDLRIGYARDAAFGFYYPGDLDALHAAGAELVPFDTLHDTRLPEVDGIFIGGGFPEVHMQALEANAAMRQELRRAIEAGMPVYAECGGLMYLSRSIRSDGASWKMVGAIPADIVMRERPVGRGYVELEETAAFPWPAAGERELVVRAHEFHHAAVENLAPGMRFAYTVKRGHGVDGERDGLAPGEPDEVESFVLVGPEPVEVRRRELRREVQVHQLRCEPGGRPELGELPPLGRVLAGLLLELASRRERDVLPGLPRAGRELDFPLVLDGLAHKDPPTHERPARQR